MIAPIPAREENYYPLPPPDSPMHFEVSRIDHLETISEVNPEVWQPTTPYTILRPEITNLVDTAPSYQHMQEIWEAQVRINDHPDADMALLEDGLLAAIQQLELTDHDAVVPEVIPHDTPTLDELIRPDHDNATLDELLFYYAGLLKIGGAKWICRKVI
jgi:hypothetical protein